MAEVYTPGPWKVDSRAGTVYEFDIVGPNGEDIGYANSSDGADEPALYPAAANARLMAAAPELLAALKEMVDAASFELPTEWKCFDIAADAIAKAEGQS